MSSPRTIPEPREARFAGQPYLLRCLTLEDADRLIAFFKSHNEDTVRARYGYFFKEMTPARARELVGVDQTRDLALAIFTTNSHGEPEIDAVGRYFLLEDGQSAEVAFVVRETKRRLGMARTLLQALAAAAASRGLRRLVAQVQRQNSGMLALFRKEGATVRSVLGEDAVDISLPLKPAASRAVARKAAR
jgi:GNAT superfamily N-acetyltransferase